MTTQATPPVPPPPASPAGAAPTAETGSGSALARSLARLAQVFYAPVAMFRDLGRNASWLDWALPLAAGVAATILFATLVLPLLDTLTPARETLEARGVAPDQIERQLAGQRQFLEGPFRPVITVVQGGGYAAVLALLALIFWGGATAMGGKMRFSRTLAVVAYAWIVRLLESGLFYYVASGRDEPLRTDRIASVLVTNPASFLPVSQADTVGYAVVSSLNLFTLWVMALIALGLSEAGRLSRGAAFGVVGFLFVAWLGIVAAWAAIF